jgi:hypothetical protein
MTDMDTETHHNSATRIFPRDWRNRHDAADHRSHRNAAARLERERLNMEWMHDLAIFAGGAFLTNSIPHFVSGVMGRPFQSPFAKPRGQGLSSSTVNVVWGFFNLAAGYALVCRVGSFDLYSTGDAVALGSAILFSGIALARRFGQFNGGNAPGKA